jgi:hypothetical protein
LKGRAWSGAAGGAGKSIEAGEHLGEGEGLDEVVVGSRVEASDDVVFSVACSDHEDERASICRAKDECDVDAVAAWQTEIKEDGIEVVT